MSWIAVGIGAAVGAGAGAIYGSQKGGDEVWKDALIGGALGAVGGVGVGAMGAGAGAAGAGAAEAGAVGAGAGAAEAGAVGAGVGAAEAGSGLALGGAGLETGGAMGIGGLEAGTAASGGAGVAGTGSAVGSSVAPISSGQLAGGAAGSSAFGGGAGAGGIGGAGGAGTGVAGTGAAGSGAVGAGGAGTGGGTAGGGAAAKTGLGGWWGGLSTLEKAGITGAGTLGLGYLLKQDSNKYGVPETESYSGSLSKLKYDPSTYKPDYVRPNVYQARYAEGGIAALAGGGDPMNSMDNQLYPQSQQVHTNFATPTQYPNSMNAAMAADYDARTNPRTGQELPMGMANGGVAYYAEGGDAQAAPAQGGADAYLQSMYAADPNIGAGMNTLGAFMPQNVPAQQAIRATQMPSGRSGTYADVLVPAFNTGNFDKPMESYQNRVAREKAEEEASLAARLQAEGNGVEQNFAMGGTAYYSLGGYSDGGRMLRGPGDGVSDSIPASIGGKQPARLADGEFVVPARAVSELGNGSTEAGAKQLYAMLDRIQSKRKKGSGLAYQAHPKKMMPV